MNAKTREAIIRHGRQLLAIFPQATEQDPVGLCSKLRRLEAKAEAIGLQLCNGPEMAEGEQERRVDAVLAKVNKLLGNVHEYQPRTGAKCGCRRGQDRDNCSNCEGTGQVIDFRAIRNRRPLVPVFVNLDPRGYSLKIRDEWVREHDAKIHRDMGGYGIIAPDLTEGGRG